MSTSPYFTSSGRQTRSVAREAIATLSAKQKQPRRHIRIEYEEQQEDSSRDDKKTEDVAAKKRKKDTSTMETQGSTWQPTNWREQLANIREMRKTRDAPVDSQGCEKTADESQAPEVRGVKIGNRVGGVRDEPTQRSPFRQLSCFKSGRNFLSGQCQKNSFTLGS